MDHNTLSSLTECPITDQSYSLTDRLRVPWEQMFLERETQKIASEASQIIRMLNNRLNVWSDINMVVSPGSPHKSSVMFLPTPLPLIFDPKRKPITREKFKNTDFNQNLDWLLHPVNVIIFWPVQIHAITWNWGGGVCQPPQGLKFVGNWGGVRIVFWGVKPPQPPPVNSSTDCDINRNKLSSS